MSSYEHKKLIEEILGIDRYPDDDVQFEVWMKGKAQLQLIEQNAQSNELIIYAAGPHTFVHSVAVPNDVISKAKQSDLLSWSGDPYISIASYVWSGATQDLSIERESQRPFYNTSPLNGVTQLIFGRTFEGWKDQNRDYFEVNQEFAHLAGIHYRPEYGAYCRFDENGDLARAVSISARSDDSAVALVTFQRDILENYLAASGMSLVRLFDFTIVKKGHFTGWGPNAERTIEVSQDFSYRQQAITHACYTRGYQVVRTKLPHAEIRKNIEDGWFGNISRLHAEFTAHDVRNDVVRKISTDPSATTNYFEAKDNILPFELSPAFFRPEVLSKYKTDREKYTVGDREVSCRTAWRLRGVDVNDAGQVHAYICDLRQLPYNEQLHWLSYNEPPKSSISERAFVSDFKGEFTNHSSPRNQIISKLQSWTEFTRWWWTLTDKSLLDRANPPLTSSKDEWADSFMDLSKLIVEGFEVAAIRSELIRQNVTFQKGDQSIALLEKLLSSRLRISIQLSGLRTAQRIRSKVKGHSGSTEGQALADDAISTYGSYAKHFEVICQTISDELNVIEDNIS